MTLRQLLDSERLALEPTSRAEIQELLRVSARSMRDAAVSGLSLEGQFNHAYEAVLLLATIPLRCAGYRTRGESHHFAVFDALPELMGEEMKETARYFQACRRTRSQATYHRASVVTRSEVDELSREAEAMDRNVRLWLKSNYPQYA